MGLVLFGGFSNRFVGEELFDLHIGHHTIVLTELFHDIPKQEHFDNQDGQRDNDAQRLEHVEVNVDEQADQRDYRAENRPAQTVLRFSSALAMFFIAMLSFFWASFTLNWLWVICR